MQHLCKNSKTELSMSGGILSLSHLEKNGITEYYKFHNQKNATAALRDLRRMKEKELSEIEVDILAKKPSSIERIIEQEERAYRRSNAIKKGMGRAIFGRQNVGRPSYAESTEKFLEKPSSQRAIAAINEGLSLR
jgi:hypothetical protein